MATNSSKSLAQMTATERLAFYRQAAKAAKPAEAKVTLAERVGVIGASLGNFTTDVSAAYKFHRYQ